MSRPAAILLVIAGSLAAVVVWLSSAPLPGPTPRPSAPASSTAGPEEHPEQVLETGRADPGRKPSEGALAEAPLSEGAAASSSEDRGAMISGCLVDERGDPVVGAEARLIGVLNQALMRSGSAVSSWTNLVRSSGDRGCFEIIFVPPSDRSFELRVQQAGYALRAWRWSSIVAGQRVDLGEIRLERGAELLVTVLDGEGHPFPSGWRAELAGQISGSKIELHAAPESGGGLRFTSVPPGEWDVVARGIAGPDQVSAHVSLLQGEQKEIILHAPGSGRLHPLRIDVIPLRLLPLERSIENVRLTAEDGRIIEPDPPAAGANFVRTSFFFAGLAPGAYRVAIRDPRFEAWDGEITIPEDDFVLARLTGSATVRLTVRHDEADVIEYAAQLIAVRGTERRSFPLDGGPAELNPPELNPKRGVYRGIVPGKWWLEVTSPGLGRTERDLGEILPGERRTVAIDLDKGVSIGGRVEDEHGTETVGAIVRLTRSESGSAPAPEAVVACGPGGGFRFDDIEPGTYGVQAFLNGFASTRMEITTDGSQETGGFDLSFTGCAHLRGRFIVPDGCGGMRLDVGLGGSTSEPASWIARADPSGRFELGPVAPGTYRMLLRPTEGSTGPQYLEGAALEDTIILAAGMQERDLPLPSAAWGELLVAVSVHGTILERVWVNALAGQAWAREHALVGAAYPVGPLPSGPCRIWVAPDDGSWCHVIPGQVLVQRCEQTRIDVRCDLVQRRLRVLDASGVPAAGENLVVRMAPSAGGLMALRVIPDFDGFVLLNLPVGNRFQVGRAADASGNLLPDPGAEFEWLADGPTPMEVRIRGE